MSDCHCKACGGFCVGPGEYCTYECEAKALRAEVQEMRERLEAGEVGYRFFERCRHTPGDEWLDW